MQHKQLHPRQVHTVIRPTQFHDGSSIVKIRPLSGRLPLNRVNMNVPTRRQQHRSRQYKPNYRHPPRDKRATSLSARSIMSRSRPHLRSRHRASSRARTNGNRSRPQHTRNRRRKVTIRQNISQGPSSTRNASHRRSQSSRTRRRMISRRKVPTTNINRQLRSSPHTSAPPSPRHTGHQPVTPPTLVLSQSTPAPA